MLNVVSTLNKEENALSWQMIIQLFDGATQVGEATAYGIEGGEEVTAYLDQADYYSPWVPYDAMMSIEYDHTNYYMAKNIGFLHMMTIFEEHRGKKYATYFLKAIENHIRSHGMETMILQPYPLEEDDETYFGMIENLVSFYESKGYTFYETKEPKLTPYYFKALATITN